MHHDSGTFTEGSVRANIFRLAWPMMIAQIVGVLYNIVDRMFIGHMPEIGGEALTGLGVVFPLITLFNAFANLAGQGGTSYFAIARGRESDDEAKKIQGNALYMLLVMSAGLMLVSYVFETPLLKMFGGSETTIPYASEYMRIYVLGTFFQLISLGMNPFLGAQGFATIGMLSIVIGAVVNLILDPIFIYWMKLGVRGAAIATVISQAVSAAWTLLFLTGKRANVRIDRQSLSPDKYHISQIFVLGFANFVFQLTNTLTLAVSNKVLLRYGGDVQVGVMTVVMSIRQVFSMPVNATSNASKPFLSFNYGAGEGKRVVAGIRLILGFCLVLTTLSSIVIVSFPRFFLKVFTSDAGIIEAGPLPLQIYFACFLFMSFQMVGQATFTSLGFPKEATFFSLLRKVFLVVPLTLLLPKIPALGVLGVYLAETISQVVGGTACFSTMWHRIGRKLQKNKPIR